MMKRRPCAFAAAMAAELDGSCDARFRSDNIVLPHAFFVPESAIVDWLGPDHPSTQVHGTLLDSVCEESDHNVNLHALSGGRSFQAVVFMWMALAGSKYAS